MYIYTKIVNGVRKAYGSDSFCPTANDTELTYKDYDGDQLTLVNGDVYVNAGVVDGIKYMRRRSDDKIVNVYHKTTPIIGKVVTKTVSSIKVKTAPTTVSYTAGQTLSLTGLVITATYADGDTKDITWSASAGITASPANGATLKTTDKNVTLTYSGKTCKQAITVTA